MGKGNLAKWWRFFTAYGIPTFLTFDNDTKADEDKRKRKDALATIGFSEESEVENIISREDWYIGDSCCVFGQDFEQVMRVSFSNYRQLEEEARQTIGDSKSLVARYIAEKLELNEEDTGWAKFKNLKQMLENLGTIDSSESQGQDLFNDDLPFE